MTPRTLIILVVLGVVAIAGGWYFGIATLPTNQSSADAGKLMFPELAPRLQQAAKIEVVHQGKPMLIEKREVAGAVRWGLADRGGYPVQETKLRSMLTALTELRLVEQRTADPAQFATLGVEDPNGKDANSNLLRVLDGSGKPILALIVGHRRVRTGGNVPEEVYVRRPAEDQSWLAEGSLQVDSDPQLWLDRDIMNIDHSRIAKVVVTHGNATLDFVRTNDKLALDAPADHPKLDDYKLEDVSRALELLTFEDVQPDTSATGELVGKSVFCTSDGLTVTASMYRAAPNAGSKPDGTAKPGDDTTPGTAAKPDSDTTSGAAAKPDGNATSGGTTKPDADREVFARFSVTGNDKAKTEADRLQARLAGWTYQLGAWKQKSLVPSLDDLKAPAAEKSAPATDAPAPAAADVPSVAAAPTGPDGTPAPSAPAVPSAPAASTAPADSSAPSAAPPGSTPAAAASHPEPARESGASGSVAAPAPGPRARP